MCKPASVLMRLNKRKILIFFAGLLVILLAILVFVYISLQPPKLQVPAQKDHTLKNVTIWNPGSPIIPQQTIQISDGTIQDIRQSQQNDHSSICEGCFVMPGLIDAHIHTPPSIAIGNRELFSLLYLQHGVTSVRDLGQLDADLPDLVENLNSGAIARPRMYYCGPILDGDPPSVPGAVLVTDAQDGQRRVTHHASLGVDCIKIYGNLSPDAFKGVSETAKKFDLPLIGHTPNAMSFNDISDFESQHYTGIPYLVKPAPKERAYKSQDLIDMTAEEIRAVVDVMAANNIAFLPTNANGMSRLTVSDSKRFPPSDGFNYLPEFWEIAWPSIVSHPETKAEIETELAALPLALSFIRQARESGVDILVGTDVVMPYVIPGESIHQQLKLMSDALGSDEKALQAATQINGRHIDAGKIGEISTGAYADILLYRDDPRGKLENIKQWDYAMVGGRLYAREDVDLAAERFGRHFRGRLYSAVMNTAYGFLASDYEDSDVSKH